MPPAERGRRMNPAQVRGLGQAPALDRRLGVSEPTLLLAQTRHWRLGQRVEGAPAVLAAEPQQSMRTAPADDFAPRAMRTALTLDPLHAGRPQRVLAPLAPRLLGRPAIRSRLLQRRQRLDSLRRAHPRNRSQPNRKSLGLH